MIDPTANDNQLPIKETQQEADKTQAVVQKVPSLKTEPTQTQENKERCWTCNKKIGLTGIQCRCTYVFCGKHRYPKEHQCTYDYQKDQKEKLQKENPVVTAEKIRKI